jgi:hypothetical protein
MIENTTIPLTLMLIKSPDLKSEDYQNKSKQWRLN